MENLGADIQQLQKVYDIIVNFLVTYSFQLLGALLVMLVGLFVANKVNKLVLKACESKKLDITLSRFIANIAKIVVVVMVGIICLNMIGISITPLVAAIGALSLGAGLAIQGLLSNYGAGLNIILTRPFIVGDTISVQGVSGQVQDIFLAYTILVNEDDVRITIPNKHIVGEIIHNSDEVTLVELDVGVSYSSDLEQVINVLTEVVEKHDLVDEKIPVQVGIKEFADSSVNLQVRYSALTNRAIASRFAINKLIWDTLQENKVAIPFPQREVRML
ncbi:mechanosensitive ion channel family protein [Agarilytica rhodophyticola]|uniref:mechanosensitive ion channel family protein n=1 Tax=Agarilytica rhodophyticola TaxID=1737490 RepID=UPI000B341D13|nr:mechanosensitive ion channel family protein [Agarilytica rhodophyticola]